MITINKIISKIINKGISISIAESCTGGLIVNSLTRNKGVSKIFSFGIICYSNNSKIKYLSVPEKKLIKFGAVSPEVALEMIKGLYRTQRTQICVSTTGIAGPGGGTKEKPVGLVYIGIRFQNKNLIFKKKYKGSRIIIQKKTRDFIFREINRLI